MAATPALDPNLIKGACADGDMAAMEDICTTLSGNIRQRQAQVEQSETQLVGRGEFLSDSLIANFAYRMLRACQQNNISPPVGLVDLFQLLLKQDRRPQRSELRYLQRMDALAFLQDHPEAGVREIARSVGVSPSTVTRWKARYLI